MPRSAFAHETRNLLERESKLTEGGDMTDTTNFTGIWLSRYEFFSSSRGETFTGSHRVEVTHVEDRISVRSTQSSASALSMELHANPTHNVLSGTWTETTDPAGYYAGRQFDGIVM